MLELQQVRIDIRRVDGTFNGHVRGDGNPGDISTRFGRGSLSGNNGNHGRARCIKWRQTDRDRRGSGDPR